MRSTATDVILYKMFIGKLNRVCIILKYVGKWAKLMEREPFSNVP